MRNIKKAFLVFSIVAGYGLVNPSLAAKPDENLQPAATGPCVAGRVTYINQSLNTATGATGQVSVEVGFDTTNFNTYQNRKKVIFRTGGNEQKWDVLAARSEMIDTLRKALVKQSAVRVNLLSDDGSSCDDMAFYHAQIRICTMDENCNN